MSSKISALGAILGSAVAQTADLLPVVDTSVTTTKSLLISELSIAQNVVGTEQATTSGTSKSFTIPAWATRVVMQIKGVSLDATGDLRVYPDLLTGAFGAVKNAAGTVSSYIQLAGLIQAIFVTPYGTQTSGLVIEGALELTRENSSGTVWLAKSIASTSNAATNVYSGSGRITCSAMFTSIGIYSGGTNFDAGAVNVSHS